MSNRKTPKIPFCNFHGHSTFSIFDGIGYPEEHIDFAYSNGLSGTAFTDHGNMNGMVYAYLKAQKMKKEGIKDFRVLFGNEMYVHPDLEQWRELKEKTKNDKKLVKTAKEEIELNSEDETETKSKTKNPLNKRGHLVLVAANQTGLQNLYKLTSESYLQENFYRFPRVDFKLLKKYNEGIIVSSACMGSLANISWWEHKDEGDAAVLADMEKTVGKLYDIFGNRFYGELQWLNNFNQHKVNQFMIQLSKQMGFKLITTCDSHYPDPSKWKDREIYKALGWLNKKSDFDINTLPNKIDEMEYQLYPKNGDELFESYKKTSQQQGFSYDDNLILDSIERTSDILKNQIEQFEPDTNIKLPSFAIPAGFTADDALKNFAIEGIKKKGLYKDKEYVDRMNFELDVITKKKFSQYFLTTKSITDLAQENMYCGISRGCFTPECKVKMNSGELKEISNIVIGDRVICHDGTSQLVTNTLKYAVNEELLEIEMEDGRIIRCTKEHKILTKFGWKMAKELTEEDDIIEV